MGPRLLPLHAGRRPGFPDGEALKTDMVGLNTGIVSNPAAPFDGVNAFGLGREDGRVGIEGFLEPKYLAMPRTYAAAPGLGGGTVAG